MSQTVTPRDAHRVPGARPDSRQLTKLYSDVKQSYRHAIPAATINDSPEISALNRRFRMQKDRLIAWGLEWTDSNDASAEGPIGASVERAGLTDLVSSIMETLVSMIDEVERMKSHAATSPASPMDYPPEKVFVWNAANMSQFEGLIVDITSSIDLLCDLSRSRRDVHPKAKEAGFLHEDSALAEKRALSDREVANATNELARDLSAMDEPLNTAREISRSQLILPEEAPPPYDSSGIPCPVRIVGRLRVKDSYTDFKGNHHREATVPVLVEYARFDICYHKQVMDLPFNRLEQLSRLLSGTQSDRPSALLTLLGHFEDPSGPRIGLVYELPRWAAPTSPLLMQPASTMKPASLFNLLQSASKSQYNAATPIITPALEERFTLAAELVSAFSRLEMNDFTHRDVNSGCITFFPKNPTTQAGTSTAMGLQYILRKPVVCAFDLFSEFDLDPSPENVNQNIYRHPEHPRIRDPHRRDPASYKYRAHFDLYSLGLLLLEIGLWVPLAELFKVKYSLKDFGLRLEKIWIPRLASKCGTAYMQAVQACINIDNVLSEQEATLGQTFDIIKGKLARCSLLDNAPDEPFTETIPPQSSISSIYNAPEKPPNRHSASHNSPGLNRTLLAHTPISVPAEQRSSAQALPPPGAYPKVALEPDFELPCVAEDCLLDDSAHAKPLRYTFPFVPVSRAIQQEGRVIAKRLCKIGERVLDTKESSSIAFHSFGSDEQTAKPTFCIMCTSTRKFYKAIKKHLDLDTTRFGLVVFKGDIVRSKAARYTGVARRSARTSAGETARNPDHHVRPICGSSIGAWKDYEHLPPVSFGGVVLVDGEPYGMSVHHMLEAPDEEEEEDEPSEDTVSGAEVDAATNRSMAGRQDSMASLHDTLSRANTDSASDGASDSDVESLTFSDVDEEFDELDHEGDTPGIAAGDGDELAITQPALADIAEDFFPVEEDKDDDHLDSHSLGYVHASSGIRRAKHAGIEHEIDWALLKLDSNRLQPHNVVAGGRKYSSSNAHRTTPQLLPPVCRKPYGPEEDIYPSSFLASDELSNLPIHCRGRTSGLSPGRIGLMMEFVKMAGRRSWTESWTVHGGTGSPSAPMGGSNQDSQACMPQLGTPGDSGAWIVDNDEGRVCGHVLAWSEKKQVAYIAPMEVLLSDMRRVLGTDSIVLPGQDVSLSVNADTRRSRYVSAGYRLGTAVHLLSSFHRNIVMSASMNAASQVCTKAEAKARASMKSDTLSSDLGAMRIAAGEEQAQEGSNKLLAQHVLISGSPGHMEREWSARRSALGLQATS